MYHRLKPRVLCIDDEPAVCDFLRAILEQSGDFLVETGISAFAALAQAQRFKPDVIMLDLNMEEMNGITLARRIREEPWLRHRPIIFFSGTEPVQLSLNPGLDGPVEFLRKGSPIAAIERTVRQHASERLALYNSSKPKPLTPLSREAA